MDYNFISEQFTDELKILLAFAREVASEWGYAHVEPEHILLALLRDPSTIAAILLQRAGADLAPVHLSLEAYLEHNRPSSKLSEGYFSDMALRVFERALRLAGDEASDRVSTVHLLLAIVVDGQSYAAEVLSKYGVFNEISHPESFGTPEGITALQRLWPKHTHLNDPALCVSVSADIPTWVDADDAAELLADFVTTLSQLHIGLGGTGLTVDGDNIEILHPASSQVGL
jgi:hypothetical protein